MRERPTFKPNITTRRCFFKINNTPIVSIHLFNPGWMFINIFRFINSVFHSLPQDSPPCMTLRPAIVSYLPKGSEPATDLRGIYKMGRVQVTKDSRRGIEPLLLRWRNLSMPLHQRDGLTIEYFSRD